MISAEKIKEILSCKIAGTGIFLVEVIVRPGNLISIYLDKPEGITMDECSEINRYLNSNLDRDDEDYELEVSSPGLGTPFKVREQYIKNIGKEIEVILKNGKKLEGKLLSYTVQEIELEMMVKDGLKNKGKERITKIMKIGLESIKATRSVIKFK